MEDRYSESKELLEETVHGIATPSIDAPTPLINLVRSSHRWEILWSIGWRFMSALSSSLLILGVLHAFSKMGTLSRWEKRWFNVLAVFLSSLVSMSLGSLLGFLGSMMRWPLLARKINKPLDVDLILGMSNPSGALRLVWQATKRDKKWTSTTVIVMLYLVINIIGRLSVSAFGLTFDLAELPGIDYPVKVTDWSTDAWFKLYKDSLVGTFGDYGRVDPNFIRMDKYATIGLLTVPTEFTSTDPSNYTMVNSGGKGLDRKVEGKKVTYSYSLKEFRGLEVNSSKSKTVHSSSTCIGRRLYGSNVYENGTKVGNIEKVGPASQGFLQILDGIYTYFDKAVNDYLWAAPLDYGKLSNPSACVTTYLYTEEYLSFKETKERNATYFECTTCLEDQNNKPGIGTDLLFGLPASNSSYVANLLLRFGFFERAYKFYTIGEKDDSLVIRLYSGMNKNAHFMNNLNSAMPKDKPQAPVPVDAELYAAHLAARLPILSIIGADEQLPRVTREKNASEKPFISTALEVRWRRAISVLVALLVGQVVAIAAVMFWCRDIFVRDHDSYLSIARLMKTAINKIEGRSVETGEELAKFLEEEGVRMVYGTRQNKSDLYEVDLCEDVKGTFPDGTYQ